MGDFDAHIEHFSTTIDLNWLKKPYPIEVKRTLLVSGDRDLLMNEVEQLRTRYGAVAGDWESGAIAWVSHRNGVRVLILRGVTDLVGKSGGEAYGNIESFTEQAFEIMKRLVDSLPGWLRLVLTWIVPVGVMTTSPRKP